MAQAHESRWQDMQQEAANELGGVEGHQPNAVSVAIVLPAEGDLAILELNQSVIGDGHPMGLATKVIENLRRTAERVFGVDDPIVLTGNLEKLAESLRVSEFGEFSVELKFP